MTTPPPAAPAPAEPLKRRSSGTAALIFGIILSFIGALFTVRFLSLLILSMLRADPFILGQAIGAFIFVAAFGVPGILLIRRSNRARRANKEAIEAALWELEYDAQNENDDSVTLPPASAVSPTMSVTPPVPPVPPYGPPTPGAPPA